MSKYIPSEQVGCPFCAGVHFEQEKTQGSKFSAEQIYDNINLNQHFAKFENDNSPSHNIIVHNTANVTQEYVDLVTTNIAAAFDDWAQMLWSSATININVEISDQIDSLGTGGAASTVYYGNNGYGKNIWQGSAAHKVITGNRHDSIDINTTFNANWFDRFEFDYTLNETPAAKLDFKRTALHEIAHGLYSNGWRDHEKYESRFEYISVFDSNIYNGGVFNGYITDRLFDDIYMREGYHYNYSYYSDYTGIMDVPSRWGERYKLDFLDIAMARDSGLTTIFSDYIYMPYYGGIIDSGPGYNIATFKFIEDDIKINISENNILVETLDGKKNWVLKNFSFIETQTGEFLSLIKYDVDLDAIYKNEFNTFYGIRDDNYNNEFYEILERNYMGILRDNVNPDELEWAAGEIGSGRLTLGKLRDYLIEMPWTQDYVKPVLLTYEAIYGRAPDSGGLDFWVHQYRDLHALNDPSNPNVKEGFVEFLKPFVDPAQTAEFVDRYGTNPSAGDFVAGAYANVLNRAPDQGGLNYWTEVYEANHAQTAQANPWMSAANVAVEARSLILEQFVSSLEFETATADAINAFLHGAALGDTSVYSGSLWELGTQTAMMDSDPTSTAHF